MYATNIIDRLYLPNTSYPTDATIPDPHPTGYVPIISDPTQPFDNTANPPQVVNEVNPAVPGAAGR